MKFIRRLLSAFGHRRKTGSGYGSEVLFAGWVELPADFRELAARRGPAGPGRRTLSV